MKGWQIERACACSSGPSALWLFLSMKLGFLILVLASIFQIGCSDHGQGHGSLHLHQPLRGGILYELGKHGSGHNLELVTNDMGQLELFALDAHAENYVRIAQKQINLRLSDSNESITILPLHAVADPATGETVGNTSLFRSASPVIDLLPLKGSLTSLSIGSSKYENTPIQFSGNPKP